MTLLYILVIIYTSPVTGEVRIEHVPNLSKESCVAVRQGVDSSLRNQKVVSKELYCTPSNK